MVNLDAYKDLIEYIKIAHDVGGTPEGGQTWLEAGAGLINYLSQISLDSEIANSITPKEFSRDSECILSAIFLVLENLPDVNAKISKQIWATIPDVSKDLSETDMVSFYELAISRCALFIFQLRGDKIPYVQKMLLRYLFGDASIGSSLFASDLYMILVRAAPAKQRDAMVSIVMNMCKLAPAKPRTRGIAFIKRVKHPVLNFDNPNYKYLLDVNGDSYSGT